MTCLTFDEVDKLIHYDDKTGDLFWKERDSSYFSNKHGDQHKSWNTRQAGKPALTCTTGGYRKGSILNVRVKAHRVAWLLHYGTWPTGEIDHINGIKTDNRIENLRDVSRLQNVKNQKLNNRSTSGVCGVSWHKREKRWRGQISVGGKKISLGSFREFEDAVAAREAANRKYGFTDRHGKNYCENHQSRAWREQ